MTSHTRDLTPRRERLTRYTVHTVTTSYKLHLIQHRDATYKPASQLTPSSPILHLTSCVLQPRLRAEALPPSYICGCDPRTLVTEGPFQMFLYKTPEAHARPHMRVHIFKRLPQRGPCTHRSAYLLKHATRCPPPLRATIELPTRCFPAARPLSVEASGPDVALLLSHSAFPSSRDIRCLCLCLCVCG